MSREDNKRNDSLDNIKALEAFFTETVHPYYEKVLDAKKTVANIFSDINDKRRELLEKESETQYESQDNYQETSEKQEDTAYVAEEPTAAKSEIAIEPKAQEVVVETVADVTPPVVSEIVKDVEPIMEVKKEKPIIRTSIYDGKFPTSNTEKKTYDRPYQDNRNRAPYDPNRPNNYGDRPKTAYDPSKAHSYDSNDNRTRAPYDPNRPRQPYDPNRPRQPYDPNRARAPYDPNSPRPPYDPNRPRAPYDPNRPRAPYDPNRPKPPYENRGGAYGGKSDNLPVLPINPKELKNNNTTRKKVNDNKSSYDDKSTPKKSRAKLTDYSMRNYDDENAIARRLKSRRNKKETVAPVVTVIEKAVINAENVAIKVLSEKIGKSAIEIVKQLFALGVAQTINGTIDYETAALVSMELGVTLELKKDLTFEEKMEDMMLGNELDSASAITRPPVVTIMGHVDHGKTSLLDYIRNTKVAEGEAGGITQHIGAYTINIDGKPITFLDTPGHEAFTSMRARGAQVTDIAIIVVAADDGIMPQSIEAINHAKASGVSIMIAINKIDKVGANIDKTMQQLTQYGVVPEQWGGDNIVVPVSAMTGENVDKLLENILLLAEILELKANPDCSAKGTVIEAKLDKSRGPIATILVQNGTLRVSDYVVAGTTIGKIRAMLDATGRMVKEAGPSIPVSVLGFSDVPNAGDSMVVLKDEKLAKQVAEDRRIKSRDGVSGISAIKSLDDIYDKTGSAKLKELNLIVKADVQGSLEALTSELKKISNEEVIVNVVHGGVGAINESDVNLSSTIGAIIIGFNVRPTTNAKALAEKEEIDIRIYRIIYDLINDIELALKGMLAPKFKENILGHADVRQIYKITGIGTIAGCHIIDGKVSRNNKIRLLRDNIIITESHISSLKREKNDAKEVATGYDCGIGIEGYNDVKVGDVIEAYVIEEVSV